MCIGRHIVQRLYDLKVTGEAHVDVNVFCELDCDAMSERKDADLLPLHHVIEALSESCAPSPAIGRIVFAFTHQRTHSGVLGHGPPCHP
eukprot:2907059-Pleurochrysis_carterae.AAC.1